VTLETPLTHQSLMTMTTTTTMMMMMMTEMVFLTSASYRQLMRLIAREDFIEFSHLESTRSYKTWSFTAVKIQVVVLWVVTPC